MGGRALVRRFWPVALVLVLLAAAWLVAAGPGIRLRQLPAGKPTCLIFCDNGGTAPSMPAGTLPPGGHPRSGVNATAVVFLALAIVVVVAVLVAITLYLMLTAREPVPFLRRRKALDPPLPGS